MFIAKDTEWDSHASFEAWTRSEAFRLAHKDAGEHRDLYLGHPQFEGFASVEGSEEMAPAALADGRRLLRQSYPYSPGRGRNAAPKPCKTGPASPDNISPFWYGEQV